MTTEFETIEVPVVAPPKKFKTKWEKRQEAAAANVGAPTPEAPALESTKEALLKQTAVIRTVAAKIPTPGVTDSNLHHDLLRAAAVAIEKIAETL
jgi:hypothetical protein